LVGNNRVDGNIALHSLHTLWVREHNRIAAEMKKLNPSWDNEYIFQITRRIIGAMLQHITYDEYLPHIINLQHYKGYDKTSDPSIINSFSTAAFLFSDSQLPEYINQDTNEFVKRFEPIKFQETFFNREPVNDNGIEPTIYGILSEKANEVDNHFSYSVGRKFLVRPGEEFENDLMAINIQAGRDHGIPTYGYFRKVCGLSRLDTWNDLSQLMLPESVKSFSRIYSNPNDIDLYAAAISEKHVKGLQVGETFECILKRQFEALRNGDRLFYQRPGVFSEAQLKAIKKIKLSSILCANLEDIVAVQLDSFLVSNHSTNKLVDCADIPKLDLSLWKFD